MRALVLALLLAGAASAQTGPQVTVTLDPEGPVTVGTPVRIAATVLVPTFMPEPPDWPDLQIADAVTRLPERATARSRSASARRPGPVSLGRGT